MQRVIKIKLCASRPLAVAVLSTGTDRIELSPAAAWNAGGPSKRDRLPSPPLLRSPAEMICRPSRIVSAENSFLTLSPELP